MPGDLVSIKLGEIAEIELNNPPLNLMTIALTKQLQDALNQVRQSADTRVLVVSGAGEGAFCAGSDIREFLELSGHVAERKLSMENRVFRQLEKMPVPTIAAIEHHALGGGLELALCCDLRVASTDVRFGMPEVRLGVFPGSGGTQRLPRVVGHAKAREMILIGEQISADEANRIGLVNRVAPPGQAKATAYGIARQIARNGPLAVRLAKRLLDLSTEVGIAMGIDESLDASEQVFRSEDLNEGVKAFFEKREPHFRGN